MFVRMLLSLCLITQAVADDARYSVDGHVKARVLADRYPIDSLFAALSDSTAVDIESDVRLNLNASKSAWSIDAAWQLSAGHGDRIELSHLFASSNLPVLSAAANDDRRLFDLTNTIRDKGSYQVLHRLDRLSATYSTGDVVVRVGRQAISWGNGLIFSPMDLVNPFDPTAVDTEYKPGDDMIYGQYLFSNGNDLQFAQVFRRNPVSGASDPDSATSAFKYHGLAGDSEYDFFVAENHDELTLGFGGNRSIGGAVWRGDVLYSDTAAGGRFQVVSNLSYSWTLGGRNMSGIVEYYFSGFGQHGARYDAASLAGNPVLASRLERGEVYTLGRNYLAGGVMIEMHPLWTLTTNLFANLDDGSMLLQVTTRYSLGDNRDFLAALNVPIGPSGTEFGGVSTGQGGYYFSSDFSIFAQVAWYF